MTEALKNKPVRASLLSRGDFIHLIVVAAVLSFGVNILASATISGLLKSEASQAIAASIIIVPSASYLGFLALRPRHFRHQIKAVLPYHRHKHCVVPVPGYEFSCEVHRSLAAAFSENKALEAAWLDSPLCSTLDKLQKITPTQTAPPTTSATDKGPQKSNSPRYVTIMRVERSSNLEEPKAAQILREAIEFCILQELSTHLSAYFQNEKQDGKFLREYTRQDVPAFLLANRILSLLSTPIEDRAIFLKSGMAKNSSPGVIVLMYGDDGSVFSRFDLVLPNGTSVTRPKPGTLRLESKRMTVEIDVNYQGFRANLPPAFEEVFLGVDKETLIPLEVSIALSVVVKPWALLQIRGWKYHEWADSFADKLGNFASFPEFLTRIDWSSFLTHLRVGRPTGKKKAKPSKHRTEGLAVPVQQESRSQQADGN